MKKIKFSFVLTVLTIIVWCIVPKKNIAQWSNDPAVNLRVTTRGLLPQIISDDSGGTNIAYNDMPLDPIRIFVQHLDKYGNRSFPGMGVMVTDSSHLQAHRYFLVDDLAGGVIIVFDDSFFKQGESYSRASAQRINSTGQRLWGKNGIAVAPQENSRSLDLVAACSDGNSGCYVFWGVFHDRQHIDLMAQHLDNGGNFMWDSAGVKISNQFVSYESPVPCLAVDDEVGGTICLYYDSTGAKLLRMDAQGRFLWGESKSISPLGWWPNIRKDGEGGIIIAHYYEIYSEESGLRGIVGAQRINKDGNVLWDPKGVVITELADYNTFAPTLAIDQSINSYIVWKDRRSGDQDVYAQRLNPNGEPQWQKDGIKVSQFNSTKDIHNTDIVLAPDYSIIVVWRNWIQEGDVLSLRAQRIDDKGNYLWSKDVIVTNRERNSDYKVASDGNGGAIVCWYETPPEIGIYAQQINYQGELGKVITSSVKEPVIQSLPQDIHLYQNYPNPFNSDTVIKFHLPQASHVLLKVFNLSGKEVITLLNKRIKVGEEQVKWNGRDHNGENVSSGLYFVCLKTNEFVKTLKILLIR